MRKILIIVYSLFFVTSLWGGDKGGVDSIVVLNSLDSMDVTTGYMFRLLEKKYPAIFFDHNPLNVPAVTTMKEVDSIQDLLLRKYPSPPQMVVCIGGPSWLICKELFQGVWNDVPTIVCYSNDDVPASTEDLLAKKIKVDSNTVSMALLTRGTNTLSLDMPFYPKENIELMYTLIPQMKRMVFISDDRYISQIARSSISRSLESDFPNLRCTYLSTPALDTESLLDSLGRYEKNVGVLYFSWLVYKQKGSNRTYLDNKIQKIISSFSRNPVFLYQDLDMDTNRFAGGCFNLIEDYAARTAGIIASVIQGASPREISPDNTYTPRTVLDYNYLRQFKIDESLYPRDVTYLNAPQSLLKQYKYYILGGLVILLLAIAVAALRIRMVYFRKREDEKNKNVAWKYIDIIEKQNKRYALAIRASRMNSWLFDVETGIIDNACEYIADENLKNIFGRYELDKFLTIVHPEDLPVVNKVIKRLITGESEYESFLCRIESPVIEGLIVWIENHVAALEHNASGKPVKFVGTTVDISDRISMEEALKSAREEAENMSKSKFELLADISHHIKTPLNAIVGFSEILPTVSDKKEMETYVKVIENNNTVLLQLISDVLDCSKIEAGTMDFIYSAVDFRDLFIQVEQSAKAQLSKNGVALIFEDKGGEIVTRTDRNRIMQVLKNFVSNAIKFTEKGEVRFGYGLRGKDVYCYVSDTGIGIPEDELQQLFSKPEEGHKAYSPESGLGLYLCENIITSLGGLIGADATPGEGSTFWFTIPYEPAEAAASVSVSYEEKADFIDKEKATILIAEDDASNYLLFESILKKDFYLIHAWNGEEAVELFKQHKPHIILMDIKMPVLDGYGAARKIRELSSRVPIIAVTAYYDLDETNPEGDCFNGYISKPIQPGAFKESVMKLLNEKFYFTSGE